jgi:hypothetical protein
MGVVYLARDRKLDREVAVKLIQGSHPQLVRRFEREGRLLAGLEHENIVRVYDLGEIDSVPYLVLEYVRGQTLASRLAHGRPTMVEAAGIGLDILKGVQEAHRRGIVHRDLKPANVFLDAAGRARVADFGLARGTGEPGGEEDQTAAGAILGTPGYMAPEQARGERVGTPADVYAVGVILYQMLSGQKLFAGSFGDILAAQLAGPAPAPSSTNHAVPAVLDDLVGRALALKPGDRPDAEALAASLASWLGGASRSRRPAAAAAGLPERPYKMLEHFRPEDAAIFFGRDGEMHELLELIDNPRVRVLFLFGPCGIGKSSLLHAGLLPSLDRKRYDPLTLISGPDPARALREAIAARSASRNLTLPGGDPVTPSMVEHDHRLVLDLLFLMQGGSSVTPVLVLDQLEEVFTQNPRGSPHIADLFELVATLVEAQALRIKVVLSFRTEFRGDLFPLEERLSRFEKSFQVTEIKEHGLVEAIEGPARLDAYAFSYEPGFPQWLAEDIFQATRERGESALPVMQIICSQLFDRLRAATAGGGGGAGAGGGGGGIIGRELYERALGGAAGALRRYVEDRLSSGEYGQNEAMARQMLKTLTRKDQGGERYTQPVDEEELLGFPDRERSRQTLERLAADHLVLREARDGGRRRVRLASEIICQLVDAWTLEPDESERASRLLSRACRQWEEDGRGAKDLLSTGALALIDRQIANIKGVTREEAGYVETSRRHHQRRRLTLLALVTLPLVGIFTVIFTVISVRVSQQVLDGEVLRLDSTRRVVREFMVRHSERLRNESIVIAEAPQLIAAIETDDPQTVEDVLKRYQQMVASDLFVVSSAKSRILASLAQSGTRIEKASDVPGLKEALSGKAASGVMVRAKELYLTVSVPVRSGGASVAGVLTRGFGLDASFAKLVKSVAASDVVLALGDHLIVSTLAHVGTDSLRGALVSCGWGTKGGQATVALGDSEFLPLSFPVGGGCTVEDARFTLLRDLGSATGFIRWIRTALGLLGTLAVVLSVALYAYLLRRWYQ